MNAVVAVTMRMFEKDITVRSESMCPYQDQTTKFKPRLRKEEGYKVKERVDMIVTGETGGNEIGTEEIKKEDVLYLMEGMNPDVIEGLAAMFRKGNTVEIGLYNNRTNGRKILNKVCSAQTSSLSGRLTETFRLYTICCLGTYLCWW